MTTSQAQANIDLDASYGSGSPAIIYACLATNTPVLTGNGSIAEPNTTQYSTYAEVAIPNDVAHFGPSVAGIKTHLITFSFPVSAITDAGCAVLYLVFRSALNGGRIMDVVTLPAGTAVTPKWALAFGPGSISIGEG